MENFTLNDANLKEQEPPICALCVHSTSCPIGDNQHSDCNYEPMNEEDMIRSIYISYELSKMEEDQAFALAEHKRMMDKLWLLHQKSLYDLMTYGYQHELCPCCQGSGVKIGVTIEPCDKCGGVGVIEKPIDNEHQMLYMVYELSEHGNEHVKLISFHNTKEDAETYLRHSEYFKMVRGYCGPVFLQKKLGDVVKNYAHDVEYIAFKRDTYEIMGIGNWDELHEYFGIAAWKDIEDFFMGTIEVIPKEKFNMQYEINPAEFMGELYIHALSDVIMLYVTRATYKEALDLWKMYVDRYDTLGEIYENILVHLQINQDTVVMDVNEKLITKIIRDFRLIGLTIVRAAAINVIRRVHSVLKDAGMVNGLLLNNNSVAVFIVEYLLISGEYNHITD